MATLDMDLFFIARQRIVFFNQFHRTDDSFLKIRQKVDPSFHVIEDQKRTAINDKGVQIDIVCPIAKHADPHPLRMSQSEDDLWAVRIPLAEVIESARHFDQVIVAANGEMAVMRTIAPVSFVRVKHIVAAAHNKEPLKRPKVSFKPILSRS